MRRFHEIFAIILMIMVNLENMACLKTCNFHFSLQTRNDVKTIYQQFLTYKRGHEILQNGRSHQLLTQLTEAQWNRGTRRSKTDRNHMRWEDRILGMIFDRKLTFAKHLGRARNQLSFDFNLCQFSLGHVSSKQPRSLFFPSMGR